MPDSRTKQHPPGPCNSAQCPICRRWQDETFIQAHRFIFTTLGGVAEQMGLQECAYHLGRGYMEIIQHGKLPTGMQVGTCIIPSQSKTRLNRDSGELLEKGLK